MKPKLKVLIKGAGEIAIGVAWRLHQSHFHVLMIEIPKPLAIRHASRSRTPIEICIFYVSSAIFTHFGNSLEIRKRSKTG
jgi:hypothetical protein